MVSTNIQVGLKVPWVMGSRENPPPSYEQTGGRPSPSEPPAATKVILLVDGDYLLRKCLNDAAFICALDTLRDLINTHDDLSGASRSLLHAVFTEGYLPKPLRSCLITKGFITTELGLKKSEFTLVSSSSQEKAQVSVPSGLEVRIWPVVTILIDIRIDVIGDRGRPLDTK